MLKNSPKEKSRERDSMTTRLTIFFAIPKGETKSKNRCRSESKRGSNRRFLFWVTDHHHRPFATRTEEKLSSPCSSSGSGGRAKRVCTQVGSGPTLRRSAVY